VAERTSAWQARIEGEWHGRPSLFDATGTWAGYEDIRRSSVQEDGAITYYMDGGLEGGGPLAGRFRLGAPFAFGVIDSDTDRIYTGPDFHGAGRAYGGFVDAHYYGPGWQVDLNTWNHVLPDGETQVYSSVLYQGWAMIGCFNGVYKRTTDFDSSDRTRSAIEDFLASETRNGPTPYVLPTKARGAFRGTCELWGADQKLIGDVHVSIELNPIDLLRARLRTTWEGVIARSFTTDWRRDGFRSFYEGPDAWGNAQSYGRASYSTLHFADAVKVKGREFMIDAEPGMRAGETLTAVYEIFRGNVLSHVLHGVLRWENT